MTYYNLMGRVIRRVHKFYALNYFLLFVIQIQLLFPLICNDSNRIVIILMKQAFSLGPLDVKLRVRCGVHERNQDNISNVFVGFFTKLELDRKHKTLISSDNWKTLHICNHWKIRLVVLEM